jgi:hypothetical protein
MQLPCSFHAVSRQFPGSFQAASAAGHHSIAFWSMVDDVKLARRSVGHTFSQVHTYPQIHTFVLARVVVDDINYAVAEGGNVLGPTD